MFSYFAPVNNSLSNTKRTILSKGNMAVFMTFASVI